MGSFTYAGLASNDVLYLHDADHRGKQNSTRPPRLRPDVSRPIDSQRLHYGRTSFIMARRHHRLVAVPA